MYVREKEKCRESEMQIIFENDTYYVWTYAMMTTFSSNFTFLFQVHPWILYKILLR